MILSSDILTSIAQELSRSTEAQRAKKLVFYVSQRYWENDFDIVDSYSWENLLESLYENNPTIDDLKALLYHAVNTLNRKNVYTKIAQYILKRMSSLYDNNSGQALASNSSQVNQFEHELIDRIIETIENHEESPRMKKLIFAVCKQYWENDINVIDMYDMRQLLLELRRLHPNPKRLRKALETVISTINRQNFYSFIADTIVEELTLLYKYEPASTNTPDTEEEEEEDNQEETRLIPASRLQQQKGKQPVKAPSPAPKARPPARTSSPSRQVSAQAKETMVVAEPIVQAEKEVEEANPNVPEGQIIPWLQVDNLFDLKQEIMQYTNPLRAKIMLFYAIYQIDTTEQHWSIVRTCTLDDLLIRMFQHYGKNIKQIESHLMKIAQSRIEGLEPDDNQQAVSAIVEAIKHFYKKI